MRLKSDLARRICREMVYVDVSEEDAMNLRVEIASYAVGRKLNKEEIMGLALDPFSIDELGYRRMNEKYGFFEFFKHEENERKGSIAYFSRQGEAHVELS